MDALGRQAARDLLLLSLTAGSADAIGYLGLGGVFTSNMTGNVVLLGIELGQGHFESAIRHIYVLIVFILGLGLGTWLGRNAPERQWPALAFRLIGAEKILLLAFGIIWFLCAYSIAGIVSYGLLALLALAMGLQSTALFRLSAPGIGTTALTGTITAFSSGLVNLFLLKTTDGDDRKATLKRVKFLACILLLYACGATLAGFLILYATPWVGFIPVFAVAFVSWDREKLQA
jgi:uncharacterized membrane protein YoaK (UPF0700 family)